MSVTDRCNYRCVYCMPPEGVALKPRMQHLTYEELIHLGRVLCEMGFDKIRLTGGEPTVRKGLPHLIRGLRGLSGLRELSMTTNGSNLATHASIYRDAGLSRVNISLDTLDPARYRSVTGGGRLSRVLDGIDVLMRMHWTPIKLNMVVRRGFNDDEVVAMIDRFVDQPVDLRFIEYMPFVGERHLTIPWAETRAAIERRYRLVDDGRDGDLGPATRFRIVGSPCRVATIAPQSHRFCDRCNRIRVECDGTLRMCLGDRRGRVPLRAALRTGIPDDALEALIREAADSKPGHYRVDWRGEARFDGAMSRVGG